MQGKKRNKCKHCPAVFPVLPKDDPQRESRIDHLTNYHKMEDITLANYAEHFITVEEPEPKSLAAPHSRAE